MLWYVNPVLPEKDDPHRKYSISTKSISKRADIDAGNVANKQDMVDSEGQSVLKKRSLRW
jgi:hypothetical protein